MSPMFFFLLRNYVESRKKFKSIESKWNYGPGIKWVVNGSFEPLRITWPTYMVKMLSFFSKRAVIFYDWIFENLKWFCDRVLGDLFNFRSIFSVLFGK